MSRHANGSFTLGRSRRKRSRYIRGGQTRTGRIPDDGSVKEGSPRCCRLPVRTATGRVLFLRFLRLSDGGEREVGRSVRPSVRPAGILTHVGSVLRQRGGGFSCPSRLLLLRHLILHPRDALPLSATELPREASSTAPTLPLPPFACSPLLTPPPSLHLLLFRPLLPPLHVATGTTTTVRDTTTAATASTTPPPPPSPGLPHLQSRPGGFPTT